MKLLAVTLSLAVFGIALSFKLPRRPHQNGWQVLHVVRRRTRLQVQDGHAAGCNPLHLQCLCSLVYARFQRAGGQAPGVPGRESAVPADGRSRRSLQRQAIRRIAKDVTTRCLAIGPGIVLDFISPALPCRSSQAASSNFSLA